MMLTKTAQGKAGLVATHCHETSSRQIHSSRFEVGRDVAVEGGGLLALVCGAAPVLLGGNGAVTHAAQRP